jgi:hypothetical protein
MTERKLWFNGDNFTIDFLTPSLEGLTLQTCQCLLRHAPGTPLPGAKRIRRERDREPKKRRIGLGFAPKVGIRHPEKFADVLSFDIQPVTFPTYSAINSLANLPDELNISAPAATATILFTTEDDGSHRMVVQYRSQQNRFYPETVGASAVGFLDGTLDRNPTNRGKLLPVDTQTVKVSALKEMKEEIYLMPTDVVNLRIIGLARDLVNVHTEFLLFGILALNAHEVAQKAGFADKKELDDEHDFSERFLVIDGSLEAIEILLTEVKCPLPPTHSAAFVATGYLIVLEQAGLEAADEWMKHMELRVRANCQRIDEIVSAFYKRNGNVDTRRFDSRRRSGFDPALSPLVQGLPDMISELRRVDLQFYAYSGNGSYPYSGSPAGSLLWP